MFANEYLKERIDRAKEKAQKIVNGLIDTEEEAIFAMRVYLSKLYNMPIYDKYFEKRTFDELVFEIELHRASRQTGAEKANELINDNKEELSGLFDGMVDEDAWETQDLNDLTDKSFADDATKFMESGEFK